MAIYGYARVSTIDQDLEIQKQKLQQAGCSVIRAEKISGTSRKNREELTRLLEFITKGDTLVITKIDRLARSLKDLQDIIHELEQKGAELKATDQPIDTSNAGGRAFLGMLGVFAEFETNLRKERQMEGIVRAKKRGVYKGRKATAMAKSPEVIKRFKNGQKISEISKELSISRSSVYRAIQKEKEIET